MLYVALKKAIDDEGNLSGVYQTFTILTQEEIDEMEDEELDGYFAFALREASDCKNRRFIMKAGTTIN